MKTSSDSIYVPTLLTEVRMAAQAPPRVPHRLEIHLLNERLIQLLEDPKIHVHTTLTLTGDTADTLLDTYPIEDLFDTRRAQTCAEASEASRASDEAREPDQVIGLSISFVHVDGALPISVIVNGVHRTTSNRGLVTIVHRPCIILMPRDPRESISAAALAVDRICRSLTDHGRLQLSRDLDMSIRRSPELGRAIYKTALLAEAVGDPSFHRNAPAYSIPM